MKRAARDEPLFDEGDATPAEKRPRKGTEIVPATPDGMIFEGIKHGITPEGIATLTRLKLDLLDREDRKELSRALAKFQRECPPIPKSTTANITGGRGSFAYSYADLEQIVETITPHLRDNGLSLSWDSKVNGALMETTCFVTHENGQATSRTFACPVTSSAGMSEQQKYASAQMFGRRKSLEQVLGLVAVDVPDAVVREQDPTAIDAGQQQTLKDLLEEVGGDMKKFLAIYGVTEWKDLPARNYPGAVATLEARRKKGAAE